MKKRNEDIEEWIGKGGRIEGSHEIWIHERISEFEQVISRLNSW
jgi:hypothetical protein